MRANVAGLALTVFGLAGSAYALELDSLPSSDQRLLQNILEYEKTNVPRELPGSGFAVVVVQTDTSSQVCRTFRYGSGGDIDTATACRSGDRRWSIDGEAPGVIADARTEFGPSTLAGDSSEESDSGDTGTVAVAAAEVPVIPPAGERPAVLVAQSAPVTSAGDVPAADDQAGDDQAAESQVAMAPITPPVPLRRPEAPPMMLASAAPEIPPGPPRPQPRGLIEVVPPRADVPSLPMERPDGIVLASIVPTPTISQPREDTTITITATAPQTALDRKSVV